MSEYLLYLLSEKPSDSFITCAIQRVEMDDKAQAALTTATLLSESSTAHRRVWRVQSEQSLLQWRQTCAKIAEALEEDVYCLSEAQAAVQAHLLVSDMDSTFISIEVIDELAKRQGVGPAIAAVTERAMRGELDFEESLRHRVKLLSGLSDAAIDEVKAALPLSPGADQLITWCQAQPCRTALVSGGFMPFVSALKASMYIDDVRANELAVEDGKLTGELLGPIIDAEAKASYLHELCKRFEIDPKNTIALGDGANDLAMMREAGISFAYHAKPIVNEQADVAIRFGGLERVVWHFGGS